MSGRHLALATVSAGALLAAAAAAGAPPPVRGRIVAPGAQDRQPVSRPLMLAVSPTVTLIVTVEGRDSRIWGPGNVVSCATGHDEPQRTCTFEIERGKSLVMQWDANASSIGFGGWTGACSGQGNCIVPATRDATIGGRFDNANAQPLTVDVPAGYRVTTVPPWTPTSAPAPSPADWNRYSFRIRTGDSVKLVISGIPSPPATIPGSNIPLPTAGFSQDMGLGSDNWGGDCAGRADYEDCVLTMDRPHHASNEPGKFTPH